MQRLLFGVLVLSSSMVSANPGIDFLKETIKDAQIQWKSGSMSTTSARAWNAVKSNSPGALKQLESIAQKGDPDAQNMMGWLYDNAKYGVRKNPSSAVAFFKSAANQGNEVAIYNIGVLSYYGRGMPLNVNTAYEWFMRAAQSKLVTRACVRAAVLGIQSKKEPFQIDTNVQCATNRGSATGYFLRGKLEYQAGRFNAASGWLIKAANAMEPNAPWLLSRLYSHSPGLSIDNVLAAGWWEIGARLNPRKAGVNASGLASFGLTDEERAKAVHFAQSWITRHSKVAPINYAKTIIDEKD